MVASHPVDSSPIEMHTVVQSGVRGGSNTPWGGLKTRVWGARTPLCAFKTAPSVEKLAFGASLPPKPGLVASHPVNPSSLEMPTIRQSVVRGDSRTPLGRLKTRRWGECIPLYAAKSASPVQNLALEADLQQKPGMAVSHPVDPSLLKILVANTITPIKGGTKNAYGSSIRCAWRLKLALGVP